MRKTIIFILLSLFTISANSQVNCRDTTVKVTKVITTVIDSTYKICDQQPTDGIWRGVYVSGLKSIAGVKASEDKLINALNKFKFNSVHWYSIDGANAGATDLLFKRIRKETFVTDLSATASSGSTFTGTRSSWNAVHSDSADYNTFNLEYEPWNQTDVAGAWSNNITYLKQMSSCYTTSLKYITDYFGWWTKAPMTTQTPDTLAKYLSYCLIHDYRSGPDFPYMKPRCTDLNAAYKKIGKVGRVRLIISAEPSFSQTWLKTHTCDEYYQAVYTAFKAMNYTNLKLDGYVVFTLDFLQTAQTPANARLATPVVADADFVNETTVSHRQYLPFYKRLNLLNKKKLKAPKTKPE